MLVDKFFKIVNAVNNNTTWSINYVISFNEIKHEK